MSDPVSIGASQILTLAEAWRSVQKAYADAELFFCAGAAKKMADLALTVGEDMKDAAQLEAIRSGFPAVLKL